MTHPLTDSLSYREALHRYRDFDRDRLIALQKSIVAMIQTADTQGRLKAVKDLIKSKDGAK